MHIPLSVFCWFGHTLGTDSMLQMHTWCMPAAQKKGHLVMQMHTQCDKSFLVSGSTQTTHLLHSASAPVAGIIANPTCCLPTAHCHLFHCLPAPPSSASLAGRLPPSLRTFDASLNQLRGPLPAGWEAATNLSYFDVHVNGLSGSLSPSEHGCCLCMYAWSTLHRTHRLCY